MANLFARLTSNQRIPDIASAPSQAETPLYTFLASRTKACTIRLINSTSIQTLTVPKTGAYSSACSYFQALTKPKLSQLRDKFFSQSFATTNDMLKTAHDAMAHNVNLSVPRTPFSPPRPSLLKIAKVLFLRACVVLFVIFTVLFVINLLHMVRTWALRIGFSFDKRVGKVRIWVTTKRVEDIQEIGRLLFDEVGYEEGFGDELEGLDGALDELGQINF